MERIEHSISRRGFFLLSAASCGVILAAPTGAARACMQHLVQKSKLIVSVLSVDRGQSNTQQLGNALIERTPFLAKAQIREVLVNVHGLRPDSIIEIQYEVAVREPPLPNQAKTRTLTPGKTATLWVAAKDSAFVMVG